MATSAPDQIDLGYWTGHVLSFGAIVATLAGLIPVVAALAALGWYLIQIYESATVQKWLNARRQVRKSRRIARLRAEHKVLLAELEALEMVRGAQAAATEKVEVAKHEAAKLVSNQSLPAEAQGVIAPK